MSSPDSKEINLVRCLKCGKILKCSRYDTAALLEHIRNDHPEVDIVDTDTKQKRTHETQSAKLSPKSKLNLNRKKSLNYTRENDEIEKCQCSEEECVCESYRKDSTVDPTENKPQLVKDMDMTHYSITSEILERYPEIKECEYCPHNPNAQVIYTRRYRLNSPSTISKGILQRPFQHSLYYTSIEKWCPANGTIHCPKCGCNKRPLIKSRSERLTYNECGTCCLLSCWPFCFLPWLWPSHTYEYLHCANCKTFLGLYDRNTNCIKPNRLYISIKECNKYDKNPEKKSRNESAPAASVRGPKSKDLKSRNESPPPPSSKGDSAKSKDLPSIVVDGKELPPETVARLQKLKRYSSLAGIDLEALTSNSESPKSTKRDRISNKEQHNTAPSFNKSNRKRVKNYI